MNKISPKNDILPKIILAIISLLIILSSFLFIDGKTLILITYLSMSLLTYTAYAIDKNAAQNGKWRTPESSLHLLSLCGGWPGALIAQKRLRHKSKKQPFKAILWVSIGGNLSILVWLLYSGYFS